MRLSLGDAVALLRRSAACCALRQGSGTPGETRAIREVSVFMAINEVIHCEERNA